MSAVISYVDNVEFPTSEIKLKSGEHIVLTLHKNGLIIKVLPTPEGPERVLYEGNAKTVSQICAGLFDDRGESKATPLQILVSAVTQLPNARAIEDAFKTAAAAI